MCKHIKLDEIICKHYTNMGRKQNANGRTVDRETMITVRPPPPVSSRVQHFGETLNFGHISGTPGDKTGTIHRLTDQ